MVKRGTGWKDATRRLLRESSLDDFVLEAMVFSCVLTSDYIPYFDTTHPLAKRSCHWPLHSKTWLSIGSTDIVVSSSESLPRTRSLKSLEYYERLFGGFDRARACWSELKTLDDSRNTY